MGVLPLNFADKADYDRITPLKDATFSILGLNNGIAPRQQVTLRVQPADAEHLTCLSSSALIRLLKKNTIWRAASCNTSSLKSSNNAAWPGFSGAASFPDGPPFPPKARPVWRLPLREHPQLHDTA